MDYMSSYEKWFEHVTDVERRELLDLFENNREEIKDRFYRELEFGTAGLRGVMALGSNRMNTYVIRQAAEGLALYLETKPNARSRGVAIAYDSRRNSAQFARTAALVLCAHGIKTYLYNTLHAVPQLSFAVLELSCAAGIVVTASHNPPEYNGFKVYNERGGQMSPADSLEVTGFIEKTDPFSVKEASEKLARETGLLNYVGYELDEIYYQKTSALLLNRDLIERRGEELCIVYTPLFGAGSVPVSTLLTRIGFKSFHMVEEERYPNPDFPTVKAPNPEDKNAFSLALELAAKVNADIVLATDPDSDRMGVAVLHEGRYDTLTGNQIGVILMNYILSMKQASDSIKKDSIVVKSIVSTALADEVARKYGVQSVNVLTGFRFISEIIADCERMRENDFLFGFEESYGFLAGTVSRDKDGICASMMLSEAALYYKSKGMTLVDALESIYKELGYFSEYVKSYTLTGIDGSDRIASVMTKLREKNTESLILKKVTVFEDYRTSSRVYNLERQLTEKITLPKTNMLRYILDDETIICIRPSGTEPKLKIYACVRAQSRELLDKKKSEVIDAICAYIDELLA